MLTFGMPAALAAVIVAAVAPPAPSPPPAPPPAARTPATAAPATAAPATTAPAATSGAAAGASAPRAPSSDEHAAFAEGLRLFDAGDARGAERAWRAGYAIRRDAAFLVRIGEAEEKAGAPQAALKSYQQYLRESPDAADRADIEARVKRLAPPSPAKQMVAPDSETPGVMGGAGKVGGAEPRPAPGSSPPGGPPPPVATPPAVPPPSSSQTRDEDGFEDLRPLIEDAAPRSKLNTAAWVGTGATVLLLGVAGFFGASAAEKSGDANRLLLYFDEATGIPEEYGARASEYEALVADGRRNDRIAKGLLIGAGAAALTSAILFIIDGRAERTEAPTTGPHAAWGRRAKGASPARNNWTLRPSSAPGVGQTVNLALELGWSF